MGHNKARIFLALVCFLGPTAKSEKENRIRLNGSGYERIVVAISEEVPEVKTDKIINNIKRVIADTSGKLRDSTGNRRLYFKTVNILVPSWWTNVTATRSYWESYETADIKVGPENWEKNTKPFTVHSNGCGETGNFIYLTPEYVINIYDPDLETIYGPGSKRFLHEWSQYRYGVFEESGGNNGLYPKFYKTSTNEILPNLCVSDKPVFTVKDTITNGACKIDPITGVYDNNCTYELDDTFSATSSLMADDPHALYAVREFCDESNHIHETTTRHNAICGLRSVWSVFRQHPDFSVTATPDANPIFNVVKANNTRYVVLMDISGSMTDFNRFRVMTDSVRHWIKHEVSDSSYLSLVVFNDTALMLGPLTKVEGNREIFASKLPNRAGGNSCIGCGLRKALEVLAEGKTNTNGVGGVIVMITNGEENVSPNIDNVMNDVISSEVRIFSAVFGADKQEEKIENLVTSSGGKLFFIDDKTTTIDEELDGALKTALLYQHPGFLNNTLIRLFEAKYYDYNIQASDKIVVDSSIGRNFKMFIFIARSDQIQTFSLKSPDGTYYYRSSLVFRDGYALLEHPEAKTGAWEFSMRMANDIGEEVRIKVTTQTRSGVSAPVASKCYITEPSNAGVKIFAEIRQGSNPVVRISSVRAYITKPGETNHKDEIELRDTGANADENPDDGIYSSSYVNMTQPGAYTVICQVKDDGSAFIKDGYIGTNATRPGQFTRRATPEPFKMTASMITSLASIAPGRVTDLKLLNVNSSNSHFSVQFTAPGSRDYLGIAAKYEMSYSVSIKDYAFTKDTTASNGRAVLITNDMVIGGSLSPLPSGSLQSATIKITNRPASTIYIAVRAVDSSGKTGQYSNVVTVHF